MHYMKCDRRKRNWHRPTMACTRTGIPLGSIPAGDAWRSRGALARLGNGELRCALSVWPSALRASGTKRSSGRVGVFTAPKGAD